jgi:hypothetical protein
VASISGPATYIPYSVSDGGACEGAPVVVRRSGTFISSHATIQAAINAATEGDVIEVSAGTYNESVTVNKANLTIQGAGPAATFITTTGSTPGIIVASNGASIKNLGITNATQVVEGIRVSGATSGLTIDYVNFTNLGNNPGPGNAYGIQIMNSFSNLTVSNSQFVATNLGSYSRVLCIYAPANYTYSTFQVDHNNFEYFFTGIDIRSEIDGLTATYNTFGPQEVQDCQAAAAGIYIGDGPVGLFDINNILIENNTFTSYGRGVYFCDYRTGGVIGSVEIKNNTFTNSIWSSGIRLMAYEEAGTGGSAILVGPITINNNTFTQSTPIVNGNGVAMIDLRVGAESATTNSVGITNNHISFTGPFTLSTYGMVFRGPIRNINITGNTLNGNNAGGANSNMPATSGIVLQSNYSGFGPMSSTADINIVNNDIQGFVNGVAVYDFVNNIYGGIPAGASVDINSNSLTSNTKSVYSGTGKTIDATNNYWGGCPSITGPATYFPYWSTVSGTAGSFNFGGQIANITAHATAPTICAGSSTTIYATGGSSYNWYNGATNLGLGSSKVVYPVPVSPATSVLYNVTANDANGCPGAFSEVEIGVTAQPAVSIDGASTVVLGNSIDLTATGSGGSLLWSTGSSSNPITVTPASATTYSVTRTIGSCSASASHTVYVASVSAGPNQLICAGSPVTLNGTVSGITATIWAWSSDVGNFSSASQNPTFPNVGATTVFTVKVNNVDAYHAHVTVSVRVKPEANAGPDINIVGGINGTGILSGSATVGLGTPPYSWSWSGPAGGIVGSATTKNITVQSAGTYSLIVTDAYGCVSIPNDAVVTIPTGGNIYTVSGNVSYYGTINPQMHNVTVTLTGISGTTGTYTGVTPAAGTANYQIPGVPPGTYSVKFSLATAWGGVTAADIIAIQNHYKPVNPTLLKGIKFHAADVTTPWQEIDLADRNLINSKRSNPSIPFTATGNWVFTKLSDVSTLPYPSQYENSAGTSTITIIVASDLINQDYKSLCYGDVDASYTGMKDVESTTLNANDGNGLDLSNFPNPFSDMTTIEFTMPVEGSAEVNIFNLLGNKVGTISDPDNYEGIHTLYFKAGSLAPGIYIYSVTVKTSDDVIMQTGKMIISR